MQLHIMRMLTHTNTPGSRERRLHFLEICMRPSVFMCRTHTMHTTYSARSHLHPVRAWKRPHGARTQRQCARADNRRPSALVCGHHTYCACKKSNCGTCETHMCSLNMCKVNRFGVRCVRLCIVRTSFSGVRQQPQTTGTHGQATETNKFIILLGATSRSNCSARNYLGNVQRASYMRINLRLRTLTSDRARYSKRV